MLLEKVIEVKDHHIRDGAWLFFKQIEEYTIKRELREACEPGEGGFSSSQSESTDILFEGSTCLHLL